MPVPTTELGLLKGVDADDTADYLVTSLANSLTTVDGLFNNVSGHTHGGAHQGGPISSTAIANASISNAQLGPDVGRANQLTNGGFEIWQRGNGPFTANGAWTADRWQINLIGTDTMSVTADQTSPDPNSGSKTDAQVVFTLGSGAGASSLYANMILSEFKLVGTTLSLSVRVKCSTANAVRIGLNNYTSGSNWTYSAFHPGDGAYHTLTVTATLSTSASYVQAAILFAVSCTANIDNAMLVVGSQPANYVPLHPADDLARCLRYYEKIGPSGNYPEISTYTTSGGAFYFPLPWATKKVTAPTVTINGTFAYVNAGTAAITGSGSVDGIAFGATAIAGNSCIVYSNNSGYITGESNP